jgi:hypothetical protein
MKHLPQGLVVGLLAVVAAGLLSGCVIRARTRPVGVYYTTGSEVYVTQAMPPPRVEVVPTAAPYGGAVWVNGHWAWSGHGWVWTGGNWQRPAHVGAVWVGPRYVYRGGRHVYVTGHWGGGGGRVHRVQRVRGHHGGARVIVRPAPRPVHQPPPPAVGVH